RRGVARERPHPRVHRGHVDQPRAAPQAQAAAAPPPDRRARDGLAGQGLHDRAARAVLLGWPRQGRDRARTRQEGVRQAARAARAAGAARGAGGDEPAPAALTGARRSPPARGAVRAVRRAARLTTMPANPVPLRRARRRSWRRVVAALALAAGATVASGPAALAGTDAGDDVVRRYDAVVELTPDGVAHVTLELDVDLGTDPNRGPYLSYLVKQRFDDTRDRVYRMRDITASSPTAPDEVHVSEESGWLAV